MRTHLTSTFFRKVKTVPFSDITHFTSGDKYVIAHHADGELILDETLTSLEREFGKYLTRIHRRTLVKTHLIENVINHPIAKWAEVQLIGSQELLRVSQGYAPAVCKIMKDRKPLR